MDRIDLFRQFIEDCENRKEICGIGNPLAQILLVGQEFYVPMGTKVDLDSELEKNYAYCRNLLSVKSSFIIPKGEMDGDKLIRRNITWCNYQTLINKIYKRHSEVEGMLDFEKYAFTTELSSVPKTSSRFINETEKEAVLERVSKRLELFSKSDFIKDFPVIILACGGYIVNRKETGNLQINNTFGVKYGDKEGGLNGEYRNASNKKWFYTHYSTNPAVKKLVIHTGQVSQFDGALWDKMASIIQDFLNIK